MAQRERHNRLSALLMVASGFAGLGYQMLWTQQSALWLGHESTAVLATVAAFFGGLSLGALLLGRRIARSSRPARWYAGCELLIAGWGLLLSVITPPVSALLLRLTGETPAPVWQWSLAFFGTFALLLPATAAMGATLPAMERLSAELGAGARVAALYAANTFGAVLGVLGTVLWLVPLLGLARTGLVCAALNVVCAVGALWAFPSADAPARPDAVVAAPATRGALVRLGATGLLGIGYEVLVVRVLGQVTESTVYTFAWLLAVYLIGTALGAAGYQRWLSERSRRRRLTDALLLALSAACLLGTSSLWGAERVREATLSCLGSGELSAITAEAVPALLAFAPATLVMGALFSHLARQAQRARVDFGRALAINTLGAALAPALCGVLLATAWGPKVALLVVALGYLALVSRRAWRQQSAWLALAATLGLLVFAPPLAFVDVPEGGHVVSYQDGVMAAVSVVEDAQGVARLRINNRAQEGSSASQRVDGRQAWLPLLLHPEPHRALFLGLGTGVTASSAAEDPTLRVDAVELLPEVIRASTHFANSVADGAAYPRLHVIAADARRFARVSEQRYDVIVADNYHPARSGSGSLYTVEHFRAVRARLATGGLFCQWLPLHQLERESLRSIVAAFLRVFPDGSALLANNSLETPVLGLVGGQQPLRWAPERVRKRVEQVALPERVAWLGLEDELAVLGSFVAGPGALARLAGTAPVNTDDRPIVAYRAPRITYAPDSTPAERLLALLPELGISPDELLAPSTASTWSRRLSAYWLARDRFVASGRSIHPSPRVEEMLSQVRAPLLSVLSVSPDFRPAYDPLLAMASALSRSNISDARALLTELTRLQPARSEARAALARLDARP